MGEFGVDRLPAVESAWPASGREASPQGERRRVRRAQAAKSEDEDATEAGTDHEPADETTAKFDDFA